jgi:hypothetical protein
VLRASLIPFSFLRASTHTHYSSRVPGQPLKVTARPSCGRRYHRGSRTLSMVLANVNCGGPGLRSSNLGRGLPSAEISKRPRVEHDEHVGT